MVTVTERSDGDYAIEFHDDGPFLVLTLAQLNDLLRALASKGMVEVNGRRISMVRR